MNIVGGWHIAHIGAHWYEIAVQQLQQLQNSGLFEVSSKIFVTLAGFQGLSVPEFLYGLSGKITIVMSKLEDDIRPLLRALQQHCQSDNSAKIWLIHGKGATTGTFFPPNAVDYWREYMMYFIVEKWRQCVQELDDHDICGVEWRPNKETFNIDKPGGHFTGTFFWGRAQYLAEKCPPLDQYIDVIWQQCCIRCNGPCKSEAIQPHKRSALEFFSGHANPKVSCLHNFGYQIDLYHFCAYSHLYKKEK